ncbi:MAG: photosynthetic reaction center subunit H [Hyphomicrobiaceae bacterium]|nr:photosynthetic reaction center subunit H [Hyphomicrobiaceae bacterium]
MLILTATDYIDGGLIAINLFALFFLFLVLYLQKESRREGYPLFDETTGRQRDPRASLMPNPKTYKLPGGGTATAPNILKRENLDLKMRRMGPYPGAAYVPTGNPMLDAVGPASFAQRADVPDRMMSGKPRIVPTRADKNYHVSSEDANPVGMSVIGADGAKAGSVKDLWVDRAESVIRYLEVDLGTRTVLVPINFADIDAARRRISVGAILGKQFADVPATKHPDQVTLLEEDKITGYYGGGTLYATPQRSEPII